MKNIFVLLTACCLLSISQLNAQNDLALDLDGSDDYVSVPNSPSLQFGNEITIEAWIYKREFGDERIVDKDRGAGLGVCAISLDTWGDHVRAWICSNPAESNVLTPNTWYHVAATKSFPDNVVRLYINGVLEGSSASPNTGMTNTTYPLNIGRPGDGGATNNGTYNGKIDEVRVWNVARTQAQIQSNMNCPLTGPQPGLVLYLNFNNPLAIAGGNNAGKTTAIDNSGMGNNGTLLGFTLSGSTSNWITGEPNCAGVPTLSQWGLIILALIMLSFASSVIMQRQPAWAGVPASFNASSFRFSFDKQAYLVVLKILIPVAIAGFFIIHFLIGTNGLLDFTGTMVSAFIVTYIAHLVIGTKK